jgi:hypothetical protein
MGDRRYFRFLDMQAHWGGMLLRTALLPHVTACVPAYLRTCVPACVLAVRCRYLYSLPCSAGQCASACMHGKMQFILLIEPLLTCSQAAMLTWMLPLVRRREGEKVG